MGSPLNFGHKQGSMARKMLLPADIDYLISQ